jgi:RNA polymerase sigma-70 factor (ECF subfamily)
MHLDPESGIYTTMGTLQPPTDLSDPTAFRRVYESHRADLVSVAWRVLHDQAAAEDVVQDVFVGLWLSPRTFDSRRGSVRSYLTMVVRHRALDRWRSRVVAGAAAARMALQSSADSTAEDSAADRVIRSETARAVRQAIDALPPSQREAILLAYGGGLSVPEVATATGAPLGTAKSRVRLGLQAAGRRLAAGGAV